ncbi:MAG: hypothetical protein D6802_03095 [Ardenticatenia bacterium]|nr:MAG: hypothetical protein D6802_03095 [Ardenticatenia bacterium]
MSTPSTRLYPRAARTFEEAYANADYRLPLQDEQLDAFYVARFESGARLRLLKQELVWGAERGLTTKFLISGHVGCGKSTELNRLVREIERDETLRHRLFVVSYSVNEILDLQDVDYTDIVFSIVVGVYNHLEKLDLSFPRDRIDAVIEWIQKEIERFTTTTLGAEIEVGSDVGVSKLLRFINVLGVKVRGGGTIGREVRYKVKKRAPELRELVNEVLRQLKALSGMNVLLVIDDLDKLPKREALRVFRDDGPFLTLLDCMAIYTAPVSLMYELGHSVVTEAYHFYPVPMFRVSSRQPGENGHLHDIEKMKEIVYRRVSPELFEDGVVDRLVRLSGGVVRHLIKMVQDASLYCATFGHPRISHEVVEWGVNEFKRDFSRRLSLKDYARLKRIHALKAYDDGEEAWEYLQSLCVLEYVDADYWYDVHPIVQLLIAEREPFLNDFMDTNG